MAEAAAKLEETSSPSKYDNKTSHIWPVNTVVSQHFQNE